MALPAAEDGRSAPPHYRLADGRVICLDNPLTTDQATALTDPQALAALTAYRPLEQAILEDWGLQTEQIDPSAPFRLICCPLCGGTAFTTVAFSEIWCDGCQAQFNVRYTAGDPGFVVDCTMRYLQHGDSRYLIPRNEGLLLTMVFKSGGDPFAMSHTAHCHRQDCSEAQTALTDGQDSPLRAGLHACTLGDVYDWSFYGHVPTVYQYERHGYYELLWPEVGCFDKRHTDPEHSRGGHTEVWPGTAFVSVTGFTPEESQNLKAAAAMLQGDNSTNPSWDALATTLQTLAARPSQVPYVNARSSWPQWKYLAEGEKYLLHRWLLQREKTDGYTTAVPVWLVVVDAAEDSHSHRWQVVGDNICIGCGKPVTAADLDMAVNRSRPWNTPHGHCRKMWQQYGWKPALFGVETDAAPTIDEGRQ